MAQTGKLRPSVTLDGVLVVRWSHGSPGNSSAEAGGREEEEGLSRRQGGGEARPQPASFSPPREPAFLPASSRVDMAELLMRVGVGHCHCAVGQGGAFLPGLSSSKASKHTSAPAQPRATPAFAVPASGSSSVPPLGGTPWSLPASQFPLPTAMLEPELPPR